MGYDMNLVQQDNTFAAEEAQARVDFERYIKERDALESGTPEHQEAQHQATKAYEAMSRYDTSYFRLNIWGMGKTREHLVELGMAAYQYDTPAWPVGEHFGLTDEQLRELDPDADDLSDDARKYLAAGEEFKRWSPPDEPGLPLHKFGSNDGWVVTPLDCEAALRLFEQAQREKAGDVEKIRADWVQDDGTNYFDEWLAFLRRAVDHDGFEVW